MDVLNLFKKGIYIEGLQNLYVCKLRQKKSTDLLLVRRPVASIILLFVRTSLLIPLLDALCYGKVQILALLL